MTSIQESLIQVKIQEDARINKLLEALAEVSGDNFLVTRIFCYKASKDKIATLMESMEKEKIRLNTIVNELREYGIYF